MRLGLVLLLAGAACADRAAEREAERAARLQEAAGLVARLDQPDAFARVVELGEAEPLLFLEDTVSQRVRWLACVALGRIGGDEARDRLLALLKDSSGDPEQYGPLHLYAAVGLTELKDPGTAVDLLLQLSRINPDDNLAVRAAEGQTGPYWTIDAQLCDALLGVGLWTAEEELLEQMGRRHYVRVLIDAHAVLRRRTGLRLPFRYNASYADRQADIQAWRRKLRETRAERQRKHPFAADNPRFQRRLQDMIAWLGGQAVNERYIARKVVERLGEYAIPALQKALRSPHPSAQRQAALMLGRIGDPRAAPALRAALMLEDADARSEALDALHKLGDAEARPAVLARLEDPDPEVRASAAEFLWDHAQAQDREALQAALLQERSPATVTRLHGAVLLLGERSSVEPLLHIFIEGEQHDRAAALRALERAAGKTTGARATDPKERREKAAEQMRGWFR